MMTASAVRTVVHGTVVHSPVTVVHSTVTHAAITHVHSGHVLAF